MDWGLVHNPLTKKNSHPLLRVKRLLPTWFYYYAIISNLLLRFAWCLPYLPPSVLPAGLQANTQMLFIVLALAEGLRRAQWSLIRIENEQVNNPEKYRAMLEIPAVKEED